MCPVSLKINTVSAKKFLNGFLDPTKGERTFRNRQFYQDFIYHLVESIENNEKKISGSTCPRYLRSKGVQRDLRAPPL